MKFLKGHQYSITVHFFWLACVSGTIFIGCSKKAPPREIKTDVPTNQIVQIRIGYLLGITNPVLSTLEKVNYFVERDVSIRMVHFSSDQEMATALKKDEIQLGISVESTIAFNLESQNPGKYKVVIGETEPVSNANVNFIILPNSKMDSIGSLKFAKIGYFPDQALLTTCKLMLMENGLNLGEDIKFLPLEPPQYLIALESHAADALFVAETTQIGDDLRKGRTKILPKILGNSFVDPWQTHSWLFSTEFAARHPKKTKQFIRALYRSIDGLRKASGSTIKPSSVLFQKVNEIDWEALDYQAKILCDSGMTSNRVDIASFLAPLDWINGPTTKKAGR